MPIVSGVSPQEDRGVTSRVTGRHAQSVRSVTPRVTGRHAQSVRCCSEVRLDLYRHQSTLHHGRCCIVQQLQTHHLPNIDGTTTLFDTDTRTHVHTHR